MLFHGLIFFSNQRSMPLLIEHLIESIGCFFLRVEVALLRFAIFQDDLRYPLFALAIFALKDGASAISTSPTLALFIRFRLLFFVSHTISSSISSGAGLRSE